MQVAELESLLSNGEFHHATEKPDLGVHSGLWIYKRDTKAPRGFTPAGFFSSYRGGEFCEEYKSAIAMVRSRGISHGSFGNG